MDGRPVDRYALLAVARGEQIPDLVLRNARVVNVFTAEIEETDVAVFGPYIAAVRRIPDAPNTIDLEGRFLAPGFIDAHVHIESSLASPYQFARAVVPRGTTTVVCDPHEIANVHGIAGIQYMLAASEGIPLDVRVMASSCVPATPLGTAGASLDADALADLARHPRVLGLAEVMNFPGVVAGDPDVWSKIERFRDAVIDGHAPGLSGPGLAAYVAAGPGSDHECTTADEAREKLRLGMMLFVREATNARNLRDLVPALTPANFRRVALCTDDRQPPDLLDIGGIDHMIRMLIEEGIDPVEAIRMATLNPAEYFGLRDRGAITPGRRADLVAFRDLQRPVIDLVLAGGRVVARDGRDVGWPDAPRAEPPPPSMHVDWDAVRLEIPATQDRREARAIRVIPDQIVTGEERVRPAVRDGRVVADPERDILVMAVVERHHGTGRVGLGLVTGAGLRRGAIAGSIAHDHHNLIAIGADETSMLTALRAVAATGGGLVVADGDHVLASLPLPIGGLMSAEPIEVIREWLDAVVGAARQLGSPLHDPFMAMSFLGLEVIPKLKLTDLGLVDVDEFRTVDLWAPAI
ncbi:MAG TPA: adenine deaminase [Longimicrobiales bacterium]|nr:adenine deaminase [Longimicrobiales bacterium]